MDDKAMLDTDFLFQPCGAGTGWRFRMRTPLLASAKPWSAVTAP
jgi:hypothetical protein